jgi:hypothetical protein
MRRIVHSFCHKNEVEFMGISMEGRRGISGSPWMCMVYGSEDYESTGCNSVGTVLTGITTCYGRESPHVIFWDEPDLGLSDSWAAGVGQKLAELGAKPPSIRQRRS